MKQLTDYETILEVCRRSNISYVPGDCIIEAAGSEFKFSPTGQLLDVDQDEVTVADLQRQVDELEEDLDEARTALEDEKLANTKDRKRVKEAIGILEGIG